MQRICALRLRPQARVRIVARTAESRIRLSTRPCPKALHRAACALYHKGVPAPGSRMKPLVEGRQIPRGSGEGPKV